MVLQLACVVSHTCRGSIRLQGAMIHTEDTCHFVISNAGTNTFHLRAGTEVERQRWVTALELAKTKAVKACDSGNFFLFILDYNYSYHFFIDLFTEYMSNTGKSIRVLVFVAVLFISRHDMYAC